MPQIIPIKELKNTLEVSNLCHKADEPIFITKNGYGDMVLMSMETYDREINMERIYRELEISERQVKEGKERDALDALGQVREKYGL